VIVGIRGKIGAGKDVIAARLVERWGFRIVRFADALREELLERLPRTLRAMHDLLRDNPVHVCCCRSWPLEDCLRQMIYRTKPAGVRELLQEYGTDVRRRDEPEYWVRQWAARARAAGPLVVAPDVRYPNEAESVMAAGGVLWCVERPGTVVGTHDSETVMDGWTRWDAVLRNERTLEDLQTLVDALARGLAEQVA
jgi:hypothetical protein